MKTISINQPHYDDNYGSPTALRHAPAPRNAPFDMPQSKDEILKAFKAHQMKEKQLKVIYRPTRRAGEPK